MKIIAAPNAFKGSLTADRAAQAMAEGIHRVDPGIAVIRVPVSDGGDGLVIAMAHAMAADLITVTVNDPRERPVAAEYLWDADQSAAVIEMALASGLALLPEDLQDPTLTTTFGTGELIRDALDRGAKRILLGIGGSATCDGGMGVAAALGYRFLDSHGKELPPIGRSMDRVAVIDNSGADPRLAGTTFSVACDVTNPFYGPEGAAVVFGPQKGATREQVEELDKGLANFSRIIRKDMGTDLTGLEGAGAAGGLGGGMKAFFNAELTPGIDLVLDLLNFKDKVSGADLVLTAEGRIDDQTCFNKAPAGVAMSARAAGVPCLGLCGSLGEGIAPLYDLGMDAVLSICPGPVTLESAMAEGYDLLARATEQAVRTFISGRKPHGTA
ncbi:MAG: glycerate kinase [Desulfobacterales bacterium]|nr:glycerate kinase [Desulfobacterales bacterium]